MKPSNNTLPQQAVAIENDARAQWEARAYRRIEFVPGAKLSPMEVIRRNEYITAAYAEMYLRQPQVFVWAGMAALTSAAVGRGMYMMHLLQLSRLGLLIGLFGREVATIVESLGTGNLAVFKDIYWQHMAYDHGGINELRRIFEAGRLHEEAWAGWQQIDEGKQTQNQELVWQGNARLLHFEQKEVLQDVVYQQHLSLWGEVSGWIDSPILGHYESIVDFIHDGNVGEFESRWRWIEGSMLPRWRELAETQPKRVEQKLETLMMGGAPFAIGGFSAGKLLGQGMYQAMQSIRNSGIAALR